MSRQSPYPPRTPARRARHPTDGVMELRGKRSPPPAAASRGDAGAAGEARRIPQEAAGLPPPSARLREIDWTEVERLASNGLTLEQIGVELDWPGPPPPALRARLEAAVKRGRAKGSAALKRSHYEAAINGSVSAQKGMLALLESEEEDDDPVEVEEVILDAEQGEDAPVPAED